jgi:hypothetical protein
MKPAPRTAPEIFEQALDLPPGERPDFLSRACDGDAALRRRVEVLLIAHERQSGFLPESDTADAATAPLPNPHPLLAACRT